jgi:RNA polymerase sigma factor (sigma-70 family)
MEKSSSPNRKSKPTPIALDYRERTDESLLQVAKTGESTAFGVLCERYSKQLIRAALRVTRNREDAEDAVQSALLNAFVHLTNFDGRSSFSTWLTRIAINSALMILRKRRTLLEIATESADDFATGAAAHEVADHAPNPEHRYAQSEEEKILKKAVRNLRPSLREIVHIQHFQECSTREAARVVGISVTAAKSRLFHARAALRKSSVLKRMCRSRSSDGMRALSAA